MPAKPYQSIVIEECGDPLVPIPDDFARVTPHPYLAVGAPYGTRSPFFLRAGVVERLYQAQHVLQKRQPSLKLQIFDAYRPIAVQQYMVDYSFAQECKAREIQSDQLDEETADRIWEAVYQFWAVPSYDAKTPPPHSTGAAVDLTLVQTTGQAVDMGSAIDEMGEQSFPEHFSQAKTPVEQHFHQQRSLLRQVMETAGFLQHPKEWWHFSFGDQLWAWQMNKRSCNSSQEMSANKSAIYGFYD